MPDDDIFADLDRPSGGSGNDTFIKPIPGGFRSASSSPSPSQGAKNVHPVPDIINLIQHTDNNPIVSLARPLLSILTRFSQTIQHNNVNALHSRCTQEIRNFVVYAQQQGIDQQQLLLARYILCATIDEMVLNTPWGSNSAWPNQSLLSTFHKETTGGQKFFSILERLQINAAVNINLLELISICLALGFQGQYRVVNNGLGQLENIRSQLHQQIAMTRGQYEHQLSPHAQSPLREARPVMKRGVPLWVIGAITGALILTVFLGFSFALNSDAKPVSQKLEQISPPPEVLGLDDR